METNAIQVLSFLTNGVMMVIGALIMLTLWKVAGIMGEMSNRMKDAETQIKELHAEANAFAQKLNPFFTGGQELIEDILKSKRAADEARTQTPTE